MLKFQKSHWINQLLIIAVPIVALTLCAYLIISHHTTNPKYAQMVNLISGQDWSHMPGASVGPDGIKVQYLGRKIVNQDGSGGQANPPVNVLGPHLEFNGQVSIELKASQIPQQGTASLYLYSAVPIIYDEWRYQPSQVRLDFSHKTISLLAWNGRADSPYLKQSWPVSIGNSGLVELSLSKTTGQIEVSENGKKTGVVNTKRLFTSGQVWFGANTSDRQSEWLIKSLFATATKSQIRVVKPLPLTVSKQGSLTLRELSQNSPRDLLVGSAVSNYPLFSDVKYRQLVARQFNMLVPENELKAQFVHPQPDIYSFTEADSLVDFAVANNITVHGHNLVFSEANPKWIQDSTIADRQKIMTQHIDAVVGHYGSKINGWDVVDEPLNDNDVAHNDSRDLRQNIWFQAMGENYIDQAFIAARTANPTAKLYLNEYGLEADGARWQEFLSLLSRLQSRGVPIDGVGFQAHVHEQSDEIDARVLSSHIKALAGIGLVSRISEMDVYGDSPKLQSQQYSTVLKACIQLPSCTSFTMWGTTDRYGSTTEVHSYPIIYGNDLVWDWKMVPKSAFYSLRRTLEAKS